MAGDYPKRDQFFAHRFVRTLTKDAVANELGSDVCWLLTVVALQEDAKRYRAPVTYYTHQLAVLCGCDSDKKLARVRDKAVKAGWLTYIAGGKGIPGRYWCNIPGHASGIQDGPCDESGREPGENRETNGNEPGEKCPESGNKAGDKREESVLKASSNGELTNLYPTPTPDPTPEDAAESAGSLAAHQVVVTEWNFVAPVRCSRLTAKRRRDLTARLKDSWWREHWREGLARLPNCKAAHGQNRTKWKMKFEFFLKPDTLTKILEGDYDQPWTSGDRRLPLVGLNRFGGGEASEGECSGTPPAGASEDSDDAPWLRMGEGGGV